MNADVEKAVERDLSNAIHASGVVQAMSKLHSGLENFDRVADHITTLCADHRIMAKALRDQEVELRILRVKCAGTLANNLCPDHRDKQVGKLCLACSIEKADALLRAIDDAASAEDGWANIYAERIRKRADELLHEWGFEQDKAE